MKRQLFILFALFFLFEVSNATKYALVIGIGDYPIESGWAKINGDKDVPVVKDMLLVNGFSQQNIVELVNDKATAAAIQKELSALVSKVKSGDVVYIHFSGHGQRVTDIHGDEEDGFDEAWIPFDAQFSFSKGKYEGENHILDDQLNGYLSQLRSKVGSSGKITVIADACHSGGGSRAEEDSTYVVRGTSDDFVIPGATKAYTGEVGVAINWIFISACESFQCNYEYKGSGSLTYALCCQKEKLLTRSCQQVYHSIRSTFLNIMPFVQTPVVETTTEGMQQTLF